MSERLTLDEDLRLKEMAAQPESAGPQVEWQTVVASHADAFSDAVDDPGRIASIIGQALTDLLLSRHEDRIDTEANRRFVADLTLAVANRLRALKGSDPAVSEERIIDEIERTLIENDADRKSVV